MLVKSPFIVSKQPEVKSNINDSKPVKGTVVATLTADEVKQMNQISIMCDAINDASDVKYEFALETRSEWQQIWKELMIKYEINPSWPLRVDFYAGIIFITD